MLIAMDSGAMTALVDTTWSVESQDGLTLMEAANTTSI